MGEASDKLDEEGERIFEWNYLFKDVKDYSINAILAWVSGIARAVSLQAKNFGKTWIQFPTPKLIQH